MQFLNVIWPAVYVSQAFSEFWFIIFGTIAIELITIRYFLKTSWASSLVMSVVGNLVSGIIGTFIMTYGMFVWHLIADTLFFKATFNPINWIMTFILMCLGSVILEALAVKIILKKNIKKIFIPLLIGNLMSYIFIAILM
ncbi:hypothetical protein [Flavicella marina]|uniref:hypothetical protein n=1 Tax=Flavicella marina TaxID=1475951 RepID=UPI001264C81A|nr:hypothetical protein [Flavicella marina]